MAAVFMFILSWRHREIVGSYPLLILIAGEILWMLFYALHLSGCTHPASEPFFWSKLTFLGVVMVPGAFLVWSARYTQRDAWVTRRAVIFLFVEPVVFNLVIWTDPWHGWFSGSFKSTGQLGVAFWLHTLYSYIVIFIGSIMQFRHFLHVQPAYRLQAFTIMMTLPISMVANVISIATLKELKLDFSPIGFLAVGSIMSYVHLRHKLFDIRPVARHKVMDEILDGVVVLDNDNRIIDMNPAAQTMLGKTMQTAQGRPAETIIPVWNELIGKSSGPENKTIDFMIGCSQSRHIDLTLSVMFANRREPAGKLILLRDITQIKNIESALRETNSELLRKIEENESLQAQLKEQAIRDPLTGLYNRRFLEETLAHELLKSERSKEPMCLVIIDLDRFKNINDTYGHDVGDLFLMALADLLEKRTRKGDVACRFGGEEFIIVMPGAPLEAAVARINAFREEFAAMKIKAAGADIAVTFSAGLAGYPMHGLDDKSLIAAADKALYAAKETGRNRLVVASTDPQE